jgi:hypothetical protein
MVIYSKKDSLRIKKGLLPLRYNWRKDSIIYGVRDKFGTWTKIKDDSSILPVIKKIYYSLNHEKGLLLRKELQTSMNDSVIFEETDFYSRYIDDSSKRIGLNYSIDYERNYRSCMLDTFDYKKQKNLALEDERLKQKRETDEKFAKENSLRVDGTAMVEEFFSRLQFYHKIHSIDTCNAKEVINKIFIFE